MITNAASDPMMISSTTDPTVMIRLFSAPTIRLREPVVASDAEKPSSVGFVGSARAELESASSVFLKAVLNRM